MMRNLIAASTVVLCLASALPLAAQAVRHDSTRGATATINLRVPLGRQAARPSWGLTASYGQPVGVGRDGRLAIREWRVADLRFDGEGLARAELATFDLASPGGRRLYLGGDLGTKNWVFLVLFLLGGGVTAYELLNNDDDPRIQDSPPTLPRSPGVG